MSENTMKIDVVFDGPPNAVPGRWALRFEVIPEAPDSPKARLEYLRGQIQAERISYMELAELQGLAEHIDPGDVQLLEWAGVPEFPEEEPAEGDEWVLAVKDGMACASGGEIWIDVGRHLVGPVGDDESYLPDGIYTLTLKERK